MDTVAALAVVLEQSLPAAYEEARRAAADAQRQRQAMAARLQDAQQRLAAVANERGQLQHINRVLAANLRDDRDQLDEANLEIDRLRRELEFTQYTLKNANYKLDSKIAEIRGMVGGRRVEELEKEVGQLRERLLQRPELQPQPPPVVPKAPLVAKGGSRKQRLRRFVERRALSQVTRLYDEVLWMRARRDESDAATEKLLPLLCRLTAENLALQGAVNQAEG